MANGPGVSWATGVAGALNSEPTDDASLPTPPGTAADMTQSIRPGVLYAEAAPGAAVSGLFDASVGDTGAAVPSRCDAADPGKQPPMRHDDDLHPEAGYSPAASELPAKNVDIVQPTEDPAEQTAASGVRGASAAGTTPPRGGAPHSTPPGCHGGASAGGAGAGGPGQQTGSDRTDSSVVHGSRGANAGAASAEDGAGSSGATHSGGGRTGPPGRTGSDAAAPAGGAASVSSAGGGSSTGGPAGGSGGAGTGGGPGAAAAAAAAPPPLSLEPSSSVLEHVSREVIRKLRLAASAGSAEDRHVVCEELFADITCALDASAQAALLGPGGDAAAAAAAATAAGGAAAVGAGASGDAAGGSGGAGGEAAAAGRRGRARGRLYYEVLAVYYASRAAADSARALLHLCQLLWDTPWVAPIYALLLHRFLLLPRDTAVSSPTSKTLTAASSAATPATSGAKHTYGMSYSDPRVKHLNVLAHGARQLMLGDVHSGLSRFQPLWAFLAVEVAGLTPSAAAVAVDDRAGGSGRNTAAGSTGSAAAAAAGAALPPVTKIDSVPVAARPWLLAVAAAFLPYYCLEEQVSEVARRFPPPMPMPMEPPGAGGLPAGGGGGGSQAAASLAGLDFLVVEVTDVLGRINSEAGLLQYLRALRALARPPPPPPPPPASPAPPPLPAAAAGSPQPQHRAAAAAAPEDRASGSPAAAVHGRGVRRRPNAAAAEAAAAPPPPPPLAGLPAITKLRLQSELYSLTSGGGPRYAPAEVRRAAFAALDALFPGGRSLRWFVRWASRTLHLEWLEGDVSSDDPWASRGWLGWIYWPIHWCTALYGKLLLFIFQVIYGIVVWRPLRRGGPPEAVGGVVGTGGMITSEGGAGGGDARVLMGAVVPAGTRTGGAGAEVAAASASAATAAMDVVGSRAKAGPWWQPRLRSQVARRGEE